MRGFDLARSFTRVLALIFLVALPVTAHAEWFEASSDHFVVYADDSEKDIRRFSDQLERYHAAMALVTGAERSVPSPSNRVTIYVVRNDTAVRRLIDRDNRYLRGFYLARAGRALAVVPKIQASDGIAEPSMIVLLHEYAHHFIHSANKFPLPRWLSEGAAEFFASASFERDGGVWVGRPAHHRAWEIVSAEKVTSEELLDPEVYEGSRRNRYDAYYGMSWLLYHYLTFDEARKGQLTAYIRAMASGKSSRDAALAIFGDFKALDKDLAAYLRQRTMPALSLNSELVISGPVSIRKLDDGEAEVMPLVMQSKVGVTDELASKLVVEARTFAQKYPNDAVVLTALAEAELDAGNPVAAITAADSAIAVNPRRVDAYVQKGLALFNIAADSDNPEASYSLARREFIKLNKLENDHPIPMIYFYRSFVDMGLEPSRNAKDGLEWAAQLAPFDLELRMDVGKMAISEGRFSAARYYLAPVAFNPHGGEGAEAAKALLDSIKGKNEATK